MRENPGDKSQPGVRSSRPEPGLTNDARPKARHPNPSSLPIGPHMRWLQQQFQDFYGKTEAEKADHRAAVEFLRSMSRKKEASSQQNSEEIRFGMRSCVSCLDRGVDCDRELPRCSECVEEDLPLCCRAGVSVLTSREPEEQAAPPTEKTAAATAHKKTATADKKTATTDKKRRAGPSFSSPATPSSSSSTTSPPPCGFEEFRSKTMAALNRLEIELALEQSRSRANKRASPVTPLQVSRARSTLSKGSPAQLTENLDPFKREREQARRATREERAADPKGKASPAGRLSPIEELGGSCKLSANYQGNWEDEGNRSANIPPETTTEKSNRTEEVTNFLYLV
ncbi:hypothetical protein B0T17DRAFT_621201 [Bombardia bombarda]|uniref:Zn(2)-C6 fungal-type domain-containing protein n=1 Tax=Bombardia bombarda TaxID=252184 RepID=A0AA39U2S5_9PEZI|nr:hypothetical protein B0T17DRAFT_621201 [Bombardia bombarda]